MSVTHDPGMGDERVALCWFGNLGTRRGRELEGVASSQLARLGHGVTGRIDLGFEWICRDRG
jgi:hypothetical protein